MPREADLWQGRTTCARREPLVHGEGQLSQERATCSQRGPFVPKEGKLDLGRKTCAQKGCLFLGRVICVHRK